jgi:hypothetical protein
MVLKIRLERVYLTQGRDSEITLTQLLAKSAI